MAKVSKERCPTKLDDFTNCLHIMSGRALLRSFCYPCLMIFRCYRRFSLNKIKKITFIISESIGIVKVVQNVQIDLPTFRVTELGSDLVFILKSIIIKKYVLSNFIKQYSTQICNVSFGTQYIYFPELLTTLFFSVDWTGVILKTCNFAKNDTETAKLVSLCYFTDCHLTYSVIFLITSISFGLLMDQIYHQFLHVFSEKRGVILIKVFTEVWWRCVKEFLQT